MAMYFVNSCSQILVLFISDILFFVIMIVYVFNTGGILRKGTYEFFSPMPNLSVLNTLKKD